MAIVLGTIQVDLQCNTVSFSQGMTKMGQLSANSAKNIQRSLTMISTVATAVGASVIASFGEMAVKAEDFAFSIQRAAEAAGTSSEMFSKLAYNAKLVGTPMDTLKMSMERLGRTAGAAQSGQKQSIAAYAALGISVKDLNGPLSNSGDLMVAVASKLDKYADSTAKTYLEQTLLGRSGAELAPLLHQLATGFDSAAQQATIFGVVVGPQTAAQARQLHTVMTQLESVALGFSLRLLSGVGPALQEVGQKIIAMSTSADGMKTVGTIASDLASIIRGLGTAFQFLFDHAGAVKVVLEGIAGAKLASFFLPVIGGAIKANKGFADIGDGALTLIGKLTGLGSLVNPFKVLMAATGPAAAGLRNITSLEVTLAGNTNSLGRAWTALRSPVLNTTDAMKALTAATGKATYAGAALDMVLAVAFAPVTLTIAAITGALILLGVAFSVVKDKADAASHGAASWGDVWSASVTFVKNQVLELKLVIDELSHSMDAQDFATMLSIKQYGILGQSISQIAAQYANARTASQKLLGFINAPELKVEDTKSNAPTVPKATTEHVDEVQKKLMELRDAAKASSKELADVGKGADFERADTSAAKAKKSIDELSIYLATHLKPALTDAQKWLIQTLTSINDNSEAETKYATSLRNSTTEIQAKITAQEILNAVIGKGADATRDAHMTADAVTSNAGVDPDFQRKHAMELAQQSEAQAKLRDLTNHGTDLTGLQSVQKQIDAQKLLNAAILQGKDAVDAVTLAQEKAAINSDFDKREDNNKGDRQAALDAAHKTFDLTKQKTDLERAASMIPDVSYRQQVSDLQAAVKAADDVGQAIDRMQVAAANKGYMDSYLAAVDKATLATGNLVDGMGVFFRQMGRESASAAEEMTRVLGSAFESINGMMEKLIEGQRINFASLFRGMSAQIAKIGIQRGEQGIASMLTKATGTGDKAPTSPFSKVVGAVTGQKGVDPTVTALTRTNSILEDIRIALVGNGGTGNPATAGIGSVIGAAAGGGAGKSYGTSMVSTMTSAALSAIPGGGLFSSIFGGHRATGGSVQAGVTYDVGEMGRESFTPTQNGTITPNNRLSGSNPAIHIDARGSNDPAQTEAAVHRAMAVYAPHIVAASQRAAADHAKRIPNKGR